MARTAAALALCAALPSGAASASVLPGAPAPAWWPLLAPIPAARDLDGGGEPDRPWLWKAYGAGLGTTQAVGGASDADPDQPSDVDIPTKTLKLPEQWLESCGLVALLLSTALVNLVFCCPRAGRRGAGQEQVSLADARDVALEVAAPGPRPEAAPRERVDTFALTGLRGMAALHVAFGHYLSFSDVEYDLIGGASMSFFYLLSGFVMTLGYARTLTSADAEPKDAFNTKRFLKNRFARLVPTYLLTNAMNLVLMLSLATSAGGNVVDNVGPLIGGFCMTLCGANMWLYPLNAWIANDEFQVQLPSNVVTWTVQTMAFFYFAFPAILPWLRRIQRRGLAMQLLFWWQGISFTAIILVGQYGVHNSNWAYWTARAWPLSRLPVFAMGCLAAVERMHGDSDASCFCGCASRCCAGGDAARWGRRATLSLGSYFAILAASSIAFKEIEDAESKLLLRALCEAFVPLLFVNLIISLTRCKDHGLAAKLCRSRALQFMGEIAMAFYMSHVMVLMLFVILTDGFQAYPHVSIPGEALCLVISVLWGWFLTKKFEQPCQRLIRG